MRSIKPSFEIEDFDGMEMLRKIEKAGRLCYKSEDKITETSCLPFIKARLKGGHESIIEHEKISVRLFCDRGITHEIVRHRLGSYCLSGDTSILRFNQNKGHLSIKKLYERQQNRQLSGRNKLMLLRSMNEDNKIVPNKFKQIIYSGKKELYKVRTSLGYEIKTSLSHIYFTPIGQVKLKHLNVGDEIFINGLELIKNKEWLKDRRKEGLPLQDIADMAGVGYSTVRKYIRKFNITTPIGFKPKGFKPWNKGLDESDERVQRQANALRKNHHNNKKGENNSKWNYDTKNMSSSGLRLRFSKYPKVECKWCGTKDNLENHHKDKDIFNWRESNKITLCVSCHKLYHKGYNVKQVVADVVESITFEGTGDTYDIEMEEPFHNFIANGFVVHNSQESTRYCNYSQGKHGDQMTTIQPFFFDPLSVPLTDVEMPTLFFTNEGIKLLAGPQTTHSINKFDVWFITMLWAEWGYLQLLKMDASPQEARSVLPNSLKTEIVCTYNLRQWRHFFKLRSAKTAHPQMREIITPMLKEFKKKIPIIFNDIVGFECTE